MFATQATFLKFARELFIASTTFFLLIFSNSSSAELIESAQWRTISPSNVISRWNTGTKVNLGFTDVTLEMVLTLKKADEPKSSALLLNPTYIDNVKITFESKNQPNQTLIAGDKQQLSNNIEQVAGNYFIALPEDVEKIRIEASSTSSIQLNPQVLDRDSAHQYKLQSTSAQTFALAILCTAALIGLLVFIAARSYVALSFFLYEASWAILLGSIQSPIPFDPFLFISENSDIFVSYGVFGALVTGAFCHSNIFKQLLNDQFLSKFMGGIGILGVLLIVTFALGFERQALQMNTLLISIIPLAVIVLLLRKKLSGFENTIKNIYLILMISVSLTGISGIGVGSLFSITYIHAIITTLLLGYILKIELQKRSINAFKLEQDLVLATESEERSKKSLEESKAFIAMLAHEIKTPLTTLRFLISGSNNEARSEHQIQSIENVLDQTLSASDLPEGKSEKQTIRLESSILKTWSKISIPGIEKKELHLRLDEKIKTLASNFVLEIVFTNLLSNAIKYSPNQSKIRVYAILERDEINLCISNSAPTLKQEEIDLMFEKYWRSPEARRQRGTGLGLWIVKELCDKNGIQLNHKHKGNRLLLTLKLPKA